MSDQELCEFCGRPIEEEDERRKKGFFWLFGRSSAVLVAVVGLVAGLGIGAVAFGEDEAAPEAADIATTQATTTAQPTPTTSNTTTTTPTTTTTTISTTTTTTEAPIDISGTWSITVVVTEVSGSRFCTLDKPYTNSVRVVQDGDTLTLVGMGNGDDEWSGALSGTTVIFSGERREDGGLTKASFEVVLDESLTSFSGTEDWTWSDSNINCVDGKSTVTGSKEA